MMDLSLARRNEQEAQRLSRDLMQALNDKLADA